jgi:uncharacterized lipoprotein YddW (UPF0748 family)
MFRLLIAGFLTATLLRAAPAGPPPVPREFRAMWIATVGNIDWPSKPGLPVATQQAELRALLDTAQRWHLNAVILQIRTSCDALYASPLEPWSEYLSGRMGVAPSPAWDPLAFAVTEAHARGLELHAWLNPFRARYSQAISPVSAQHVSRARPDLVVQYGKFLWLDPGLAESRDQTLKVVTDVVHRYDIDGIHIDDYFYPYPDKTGPGTLAPFPDERSWSTYQRSGGKLSRPDWRRENVNTLIRAMNTAVHREKSWVKFGISPFGIWKPGFPEGIKGLDQHEVLYADARKWIREGMADYFAPQLYWRERQTEQRFTRLLAWWASENVSHRHLWPGINTADIGKNRTAAEIVWQTDQIGPETRSSGVIHWNASALRENRDGVGTRLIQGPFAHRALVPASPWLGSQPPETPSIEVGYGGRGPITIDLNAGKTRLSAVVVQTHGEWSWKTEILPGTTRRIPVPRTYRGTPPKEIRVLTVSSPGIESAPAVWRPK